MKLLLPLCVLIPLACSTEAKSPPPKSFVTKMVIDNGKESILEVNTGRWTGRITIAPDVKVDYKNVTTTTNTAGSESKTTLTLDGVLMTVEKDGLRFGTDSRLKLGDNAVVEVRKDGVYVAGDKALALPVK